MTRERFHRIAHPTDLGQESEFAFYHALRLAVAAQSHLDVLHVDAEALRPQWADYPSPGQTLAQWGMEPGVLRSNGDAELVVRIDAHGREPVRPVLDYIDESLPDLMVLATHRRKGLDRWMHKEIAQKLARSRAIATLFVPFGDEGFVSPSQGTVMLRKVLLPIDWLPAPQAAVDAAVELAEVLGCDEVEFTLLHVADSVEDFPAVTLPEQDGWTWQKQTRSGDVVDEVMDMAGDLDVDLIVMVTQGREGFLDALRGSTTERVLQRADCPVLAVPAVVAG